MDPVAKDENAEDFVNPQLFLEIETEEHFEENVETVACHRVSRTVLFPERVLRSVYIPEDCISSFLSAAAPNTERNIETCGLLVGILIDDRFQITHMFIPKQIGDDVSCVAENETEIAEFVSENNLITLGWIHTHPSHTAFLSSPDLHTQFGSQKLLPEYIAIVCSPAYEEYKMFTIEASIGMDTIRNCNSTQYFHDHPSSEDLFHECSHVITDSTSQISILDLRYI